MEFYGSNQAVEAAFGQSNPIEAFSNWSEGESVTLTGKKAGGVYFQTEAGSLRAYGANGRGPRVTYLMITNLSDTQKLRLEDGTEEEFEVKAIPLANLAKVFNHLVVDEEAMAKRLRDFAAVGQAAQLTNAAPIKKEVALHRNDWQRLFVAIYNDNNAELVEHAANKADYKAGASMAERADRILAFVGEREMLFRKDSNEVNGEKLYYISSYKDQAGNLVEYKKSRPYWQIAGVSDDEVAQCLAIADSKRISTIFSVTRLEKDFEKKEGAE